MSEGPYRTAERVPTRRRLEAEETIGRCNEKVGALQLLFVPGDLRERIERLRSAGDDVDDEVKSMLAEALEEALTIVEEREADLRSLPAAHPEAPPLDDVWGPTGTELAAGPVLDKVQALVRRSDRDAEVSRTGPRITARFARRSTPILWSVHLGGGLGPLPGSDVHSFATSSQWMGTSVRQGMPRLFIRAEGIADTVLKAFRLRAEVEVGDAAFDDAFFVEGEAEIVRALLTPELREAFVKRAHFGDFTFLLDGSDASLVWKGSLLFGLVAEGPFVSSVEVLVALRASLERLRLLQPARPPTD